MMFFDVNCTIGTWPFRPSPHCEPAELAEHLERELVDGAIISNVESLFVLDTTEQNARVLQACEGSNRFYAAPILNLRVRNWELLFSRYRTAGRLKAVRIHPNYHFYDLSHPAVAELCAALVEAGLPLIIAPRIYDERLHNPRMAVPEVPMEEIAALATAHADLTVVCVNPYLREIGFPGLPSNLSVDIAFAEDFKTLRAAVRAVGPDRVLFGSNSPIHSTRAAAMKVAWAEELSEAVRTAIARGNAERVFGLS